MSCRIQPSQPAASSCSAPLGAGKPLVEPGKSRGREVTPAFPGWLQGHKGTFLGWNYRRHIGWSCGGHRALSWGAQGSFKALCWGWGCSNRGGTPMGGAPLHVLLSCPPPSLPPAAPPASPSPWLGFHFDLRLLPSLPSSLLPCWLLPSPQVPAVTLSWFLEPVVGFLKEPWGSPTTSLLLAQTPAQPRTGPPGVGGNRE